MAIDAGVLTQIEEHYDKDIHKILFEDGKVTSPLFAMCEAKAKDDGMGRGYVVRVESYEGAAASADASVADAIAGDGAAGGRPTRNRWVVQPVNMDSTFVFTRDEILSIEKMGADEQFDVITREMDLAAVRIRNRLCQQVQDKGWGMLAQTTAQTSTTFTVSPALINRFPVGRRIVASITEDTDVLLGSPAGAQLRVTAVNTATGVVTTSANPASTWASDQDLFIFSAGDRIATDPAADQSVKTCISGLRSWIDPDGAALWGVTRAGDPNLSGLGIDCTGLDTSVGLIKGADGLFNYGREVDTVLVNGTSWKLLQQNYDVQKTVSVGLGPYAIGFQSFKLPTLFGTADVIPDPFIEAGTAYAGPFQNKKWAPYIAHSGNKLVNLDDFDGKKFERVTTSGARTFKGQFFFRGNLVLPGPGMYAKLTGLPTS